MHRSILFILISFFLSTLAFAQRDTSKPAETTKPLFGKGNEVQLKDSTKKVIIDTSGKAGKPKHDPRKATFRSAVLPGWGQAYNREYWKIPIVYGALAIPAATYVFNNNYYRWTKYAYYAVYETTIAKNPDSSSLISKINPKVLSKRTGSYYPLSTYQSARNSYKRNKDYSLLYFLLLWGVNVADATVFGHLKDFDVSDDLSLQINPSYIPSTKSTGVNLVFSLKTPSRKPLPSF